MHNAIGTLYRGSLSVLLVLLHDFPEFLTEYYFTLCDAVPPRCVQLRNIILSAYPPQLQIPDPYPRDLKLDSLPDMGPIPPILSDFTSALSSEIRNLLDAQLMGRGNTANTLTLIKQAITVPGNPPDDGSAERYNIHVMNAVVMFVGVSSVAQAKARTGSSLFVGTDPGVVLLQQLASDLDAEGKALVSRRDSVFLIAWIKNRSTSPYWVIWNPPALPQCAYPLVQFVGFAFVQGDQRRQVPRGHDQGPV